MYAAQQDAFRIVLREFRQIPLQSMDVRVKVLHFLLKHQDVSTEPATRQDCTHSLQRHQGSQLLGKASFGLLETTLSGSPADTSCQLWFLLLTASTTEAAHPDSFWAGFLGSGSYPEAAPVLSRPASPLHPLDPIHQQACPRLHQNRALNLLSDHGRGSCLYPCGVDPQN